MTLIIVLNQSIEIKLEIQSNCVLALELRFWVHFDNWAKHNGFRSQNNETFCHLTHSTVQFLQQVLRCRLKVLG